MSAPKHRIATDVELGDISSPEEVAEAVRRFYQAVAQDQILGPMFNDVAQVDWAAHLPKLTLFWCRALFGLPGYSGNPYAAHRLIHEQEPFTREHFVRWLELFTETIDEGWAGEYAETMKALARNVARVHSSHLIGEAVELTA